MIATGFAVYYYNTYKEFYEKTTKELTSISMKVNILIKYGNGTKRWFNSTLLPIGASAFNATITVARVDYITGTYGVSVTAINGISRNTAEKLYWMWWYWNATTTKWDFGPVACNEFILHNGDVVAWYYEKVTTWPPEPP